jgi:hypothetical protein
MRALSLSGLVFGPDGSLTRQECKGPPTIEHWSACFLVYATAMIMLGAVDPPNVFAYGQFVERQARQFGPLCWSILYQAEARFRREGIERLRRTLSDALDEALMANGTTLFVPTRPWDRCYCLSVEQYGYWHTNVEIPSMLVISKCKNPGTFLDGDAEAANSAAVHMATLNAPYLDLGLPAASSQPPARTPRGAPPTVRPRGTPPPAKKPRNNHTVGADGFFTANRGGAGLCIDFNKGSCSRPVTHDNGCSAGRHQCSKCLASSHPASVCSSTTAPSTSAAARKSHKGGKGRGKGKF